VVQGLLTDAGWPQVAHFTLMGKPFVLLENRSAPPSRPLRGRLSAEMKPALARSIIRGHG